MLLNAARILYHLKSVASPQDKERVRDLEECLLERDAHVQTLKTQVELLEKRLGKSGNTTSSASAAIDGDKSKLKKRDYKKQVLELTSIDNRLHSLEDSVSLHISVFEHCLRFY